MNCHFPNDINALNTFADSDLLSLAINFKNNCRIRKFVCMDFVQSVRDARN